MNRSVEQLNEALAGFAHIDELRLSMPSNQGRYDLRLVLTDSRGDKIVLNCGEISSLRIADFGGGLSQFLGLRVMDVRGRQLDRVSFHFSEGERDTIAFDCATATIETVSQ